MVVALRRILALALFIVVLIRPVNTPLSVWIAAMIASLTFFIAECFNPALTLTRRFGTGYLTVIGVIY